MGTTLYSRIASDLRDQIASGEFPPGSTLPAIPELMTRYDAARDTVRDAIRVLSVEGLVTPRRGIGTVVRETSPVRLEYAPIGAARTWEAQTAGEGTDKLVSAEWEQADRDVSSRLRVDIGERVIRRVRHHYQGQGIVQVHEQWIPGTLAELIAAKGGGDLADTTRGPGNIFQEADAAGRKPASTTERITARMPDPDEREALELPVGVPVLVTNRTTVDVDGQPIESSHIVSASDRVSQSFTVQLG
ncbi:GntR family transcriptional regulator [Actinoalloteichus caeruleus]|uniref:GntR family transcriptional regulator n=1 Tax=Actinoalloteichus cyanogriseus TaxID=2893586 RepID=UPI003AADB5E8